MRKIVLPQTVRLFKKSRIKGLLAQTGMTAEAGVEIEVGPVETMVYDHMYKAVVSFKCPQKECQETHYLLVEETGLPLTN